MGCIRLEKRSLPTQIGFQNRQGCHFLKENMRAGCLLGVRMDLRMFECPSRRHITWEGNTQIMSQFHF